MTPLTKSQEDYLEAVVFLDDDGRPATVRDVARLMSVKMPSVVKAVYELKEKGLVVQEPYAPIRLTEIGSRLGHKVLKRHVLLRDFLVRLGVPRKAADCDACEMEHVLSAETYAAVRRFMEK